MPILTSAFFPGRRPADAGSPATGRPEIAGVDAGEPREVGGRRARLRRPPRCNAMQPQTPTRPPLATLGGGTVDLSIECAGVLERLVLAQAQECFFEKVIRDAKPPSICSKVARQVGLFYEEAYAALNVVPLNQYFDRAWISHVQLKAVQFYSEACYRFSLKPQEKEEISEEISRLKIGLSALNDARKFVKGVAPPLQRLLVRAATVSRDDINVSLPSLGFYFSVSRLCPLAAAHP
ncbi:hypothetical protein KSP40_PGU009885 [Platanthera guangdongensis]|uniref:BRO1 domain-containing protein n=1 Tax=Platanthera guangdongensis TaxID=2320717 RepID=A0ABR2M601_9ASPA